jgi:Sec-independent protein translocase protein TatA
LIIGPKQLPVVIKFVLKQYKKLQKNILSFKDDIEKEIDSKEIKQDIYNELRMEELEQSELFEEKKEDD